MSYRSFYTISVDNNESINDIFNWLNNESSESGEFNLQNDEEICLEDSSWSEEEDDLEKLSLHFPNIVIEVFRDGENDGDKCYSYYKNGRVQHCPIEAKYDEYDESKLVSIHGYDSAENEQQPVEQNVPLTDFNRGYWCALQDAISNGADSTVITSMLKCAGFTYDECMHHIEASGFYKDKFLPIINSLFPEESKSFAEITMITWNGLQYPSKSLTIFKGDREEQEVTVSIEELQFELIDEAECTPISDEAESIDNTIYYYLSKEEFKLSDDEIIEILENA